MGQDPVGFRLRNFITYDEQNEFEDFPSQELTLGPNFTNKMGLCTSAEFSRWQDQSVNTAPAKCVAAWAD